MSVGFTGTRAGCTPTQHDALAAQLHILKQRGEHLLHHGACVGADREAHHIWRAAGGRCEYHPGDRPQADWAMDQLKTLGRPHEERVHVIKPYLERNKDIVRCSSVVVACPAEMEEVLRSGTWATIRYARSLGSRVILIRPDGSIL